MIIEPVTVDPARPVGIPLLSRYWRHVLFRHPVSGPRQGSGTRTAPRGPR